MRYGQALIEAAGIPWAIEPAKGQAVARFMARASVGVNSPSDMTAEEIEAKKLTTGQERKIAESPGGIAIIPIHGVMHQRLDMLAEISGGTSTDRIGRQITAAAHDDEVKVIILHVESPGGSIYGLHELSDVINRAKAIKPVIAQADSFAASAAYWVASQATELIVSPGGDVGSIGVFTLHEDISKMLEEMGVTETLIFAGDHKVDGNPFEPLSDDARKDMQARVNAAMDDFLAAVAFGRGKDVGIVSETFGQGRMVKFDEAVKRGMADRVATFSETIDRFRKPVPQTNTRRRAALRLALDEQT